MSRGRATRVALLPLAAAVASNAHGANRAIEDVRLARQNGVATVDVVLACPIEYLDHVPAVGPEVRVRIELTAACVEALGTGIRSELKEPPRTTVAEIRQVQFDTRDGREATVTIKVSTPQQFSVGQGRGRNVLRIELTPAGVAPLVPEITRAPPRPAPPPTRQPLRLVPRPEERRERYALQLAAGADAAQRMAAAEELAAERTVYVNEYADSGGGPLQELRLGFFATEDDARAYSAALPAPYSDSIVVVAGVEEQDRAAAAAPPRGATPEGAGATESAQAPAARPPPLTAERVETMTAQAGEAMLAGDLDTAIRLYASLLEDPGFAARPEARERLGIARERKGQLARARVEYTAYLAEFPAGPDAERVRQRLAGLAADAAPARVPLEQARSAAPLWEIDGGVAQYARQFELEPLDPAARSSEHSYLSSNVNLVVRRHGERFEMLQRIDAAYDYNLLDSEGEHADPEYQLHVTNAYVDLADGKHDWQARVGRQTRFGSGVVGRFDGAHVGYEWRPDITLNLALGFPVDYPRHALDTSRRFVGFSADMARLVRGWDFSFFGILQEVDGIADREAVGAEARYRSDRWHVVGAIDADPSYAVLNSALVTATWRATDRLMLNGRFNAGVKPFLATRNALLGQSAVTIDAMLDTYTEAQLRGIARDRTAQTEQATLGLSRPVLDRFQMSADVGYYAVGETVASAGVPALPDQGRQPFFNLSFVGSSLLKDGDAAVFALRHTESESAASDTLTVDWRVPMSSRWRLNPRLALSSRASADGSSRQWVAMPLLRLAVRWPNRHQFEVELGERRSTRELESTGIDPPLPDDELTETFINVGYWWELK